MQRRALVLAVLSVLFVLPSYAQKRRAVRFPAAAPVTGNCHAFGLVAAGTKASYLTTTPSGNVTFTITWLSDTPTQTKTTQQVQSPSGNADAETTLDGEVVGTLRGLKKTLVKTTTTVPVLGKLTGEVELTFVPSLILGPADGWCVGNTWNVSPVTETIVIRPPVGIPTTTTQTTIGGTGEVLAVGESVTVTGGTFNTVKYKSITVANDSIQPAITWVDMARNIVVKQETLDASGNVTSTTTLTSVQ